MYAQWKNRRLRERNLVDIPKCIVRRAQWREMSERKIKKCMNSESTDTTARCSVAHISWIAHAFCHRLLVLAGCVDVTDIHFQAGYFCTKKSRIVVLLLTYLHTALKV